MTNEELVNARIANLVTLVVRGVTLRQPQALQVHGYKDTLFVRAQLAPQVPEIEGPVVELMLQRCPNFLLSPATDIVEVDLQGEWPPTNYILDMERKIVLPRGHNGRESPKLMVAR